MDIPMGVEVFCTDGKCGRSMAVILKPKTEEVTHLVVKEKDAPHEEILIPVAAVTSMAACRKVIIANSSLLFLMNITAIISRQIGRAHV